VIDPGVLSAYACDRALYRPTRCPAWIDDLDLDVGPSHVRMGTRALDPGQWLVRDECAAVEIALRRRLLAEQREHVLACTPVAEAAAAETERLVASWLANQGGAGASATIEIDPNEVHPLARAGGTIQEDLCLMVHHHEAWHLEAACLCFPSMWSLADKLGGSATQIHAPVAHYAEELSGRVDTFFDRLAPGRLVRRRNLSLWPTCLLWMPNTGIDPQLWDPAPPDHGAPRLWLRSERQTLRRLPESGAILFTIRVQMAHMSVLAERRDRAGALASWLRGPGGEGRRRQLGSSLDDDLIWLDDVAAS
jgi:dimethylamine monooxygenase subunit A